MFEETTNFQNENGNQDVNDGEEDLSKGRMNEMIGKKQISQERRISISFSHIGRSRPWIFKDKACRIGEDVIVHIRVLHNGMFITVGSDENDSETQHERHNECEKESFDFT